MKIICHKVRVNAQGYAYSGMQYFGTGQQLYFVELDDGRSGHVRASSRKEAIETALARPAYWGIQ